MKPRMRSVWQALLTALLVNAAFAVQAQTQTQTDDPPTRVARLAYLAGGVSFRPAGVEEWIEAGLNRPLTIGDQLWSDRDGRIEMQLDGSNLRLGTETSASILNLSDQNTQIQLSGGTLIVHVRQLAGDESYEIDTPNVAFSILQPGTYRLTVEPNGASTAIAVRSGQGEAVGGNGTGYTVRAGEHDTFTGTDQIAADTAPLLPEDEFDSWSAQRDGRFDNSRSAQYVSPDVVGYEELDSQGNWDDTPEYGHVWFPTAVETGWVPYQVGHWAYVAPWGYTWIDDRPWGFAPFHYGRWVYWRQRWGWVPAPPRAPRVVYVRPVFAPALVAWVGTGATVGWFPLAPREVYVPSYPVSRRYLSAVNVSNTTINTTVINNVYNTTIINRTTINNVTYANRRVPGAIMATDPQAFASSRPVRREGNLDAAAPVRAFAPAVVPTRAAVYGGRNPATLRPPQAVQTRVTAARMAPAAAPPSVDARLQALRDARGHAPDPQQLARSTAAAPARAPAVRVLPPVHTLVSSRDFGSVRAQGTPGAAPSNGSARAPVQAGAPPPNTRGPSPAAAGTPPVRQLSPQTPPMRPEVERQRLQQDTQAADARRRQLDQQQATQQQAQSQAQAELARRQQLEQQHNAQLQQQQAQQRAQQDQQSRMQQQQAQAQEQQRAEQQQRQRELDQQVQQQHNAQLQQQQAQQRAQLETQARAQQQAQAQAQAEQQRNAQLERQRQDAQQQYQRQQQALESQRQVEQQRQQQVQQQAQQQQQQMRAREDQQRQQAAQRPAEAPRRPPPPQNPPNQRQPR